MLYPRYEAPSATSNDAAQLSQAGVHFIPEIRAMAGLLREIAVIEILGRESGLTTLLISLLAGADQNDWPIRGGQMSGYATWASLY